MKKLILFFLFFLLTPFIYAEDFFVDEIRVYVGESRERDAEVDGGDFDGYRGEVVKFRIDMENNYTTDMEKIDFFLVAQGLKRNGDDIEASEENVNIKEGDDKSIEITFQIPPDAIFDYFDIELLIEGEFENNTDLEDWEQTWELEVLKEEGDEEFTDYSYTSPSTRTEHAITNLTSICSEVIDHIPDYMNCVVDREGLQSTIDIRTTERDNQMRRIDDCEARIAEQQDFEDKYSQCINEKDILVRVKQQNNTIQARQETETSSTNFLVPLLIIGGIILIYNWNKKKQQQGEDELE